MRTASSFILPLYPIRRRFTRVLFSYFSLARHLLPPPLFRSTACFPCQRLRRRAISSRLLFFVVPPASPAKDCAAAPSPPASSFSPRAPTIPFSRAPAPHLAAFSLPPPSARTFPLLSPHRFPHLLFPAALLCPAPVPPPLRFLRRICKEIPLFFVFSAKNCYISVNPLDLPVFLCYNNYSFMLTVLTLCCLYPKTVFCQSGKSKARRIRPAKSHRRDRSEAKTKIRKSPGKKLKKSGRELQKAKQDRPQTKKSKRGKPL